MRTSTICEGGQWTSLWFLARLYKVKESLCDTPSARRRARGRARAHDRNVQFLRLGQFLSSYKG